MNVRIKETSPTAAIVSSIPSATIKSGGFLRTVSLTAGMPMGILMAITRGTTQSLDITADLPRPTGVIKTQ